MGVLTSHLRVALDCVRHGWFIFPCVPGDKVPIKGVSGYLDASNDEARVRAWWEREPRANIAMSPGKSGKVVLDVDHGLTCEDDLRAFMAAHDLPETYAVHTGARIDKETGGPTYRVQLYYDGAGVDTFNGWTVGEYKGDVRGTWGHVMVAGCIHPDSKERYEVLWDLPFTPVPNFVRALRPSAKVREALDDPTAPIVEWRNDTLYRVLCKHRANGADAEMIRDFAHRAVAKMPNPLDEEELETIITNVCKKPVGLPEPIPVLGGGTAAPAAQEPPRDWREHYHTREEMENAPPVDFLIENFLADESHHRVSRTRGYAEVFGRAQCGVVPHNREAAL